MTDIGEDVAQQLLSHAKRQTKAIEGIYGIVTVYAILSVVAVLVLVISIS